MKGKVSILHISDLHRSPGAEISNSALLSSLINDRGKYAKVEAAKIQSPDIIIVSGDVVRGSTKSNGSDDEIKNQYEEAIFFLNELVSNFLNGDKGRIIVIPGNHDIDWKYSKASMKKLDNAKIFDTPETVKPQLLRDAINQHSNIRWSWRDLSFYEIADLELYDRRLEAFSNFYRKFYDGKRIYPLSAKDQFDIFDIPKFNTTIVAYNSCFNNDHLRLVGDIHPDCIANANLKLRHHRNIGRLVIGAWHHNTKGQPYDSNYMDSSRLKNFIDSGISLGFHGHQHKTELIHDYSDVIEKKKIVVFSAGTLCGGPNELPVGNSRQYNIVEVMWNESQSLAVTLHTREKTDTSSFENPIWKPGRIDSNLVSNYTINIEKPSPVDQDAILLEIVNMTKGKKYDEAKEALLELDGMDPFVRKLMVENIIQTNDYHLAIKFLSEPITDEEMITVISATLALNLKSEMKRLLQMDSILKSSSPQVKELLKKLQAILK